MKTKIEEVKKRELVSRSRSNPRFKRRLKSKLPSGSGAYNRVDMEKLFKYDILEAVLTVRGETDNYDVTVSFEGPLKYMKEQIKRRDVINLNTIARGLTKAFERNDVMIHCTCPDFKYRFRYWATIEKYNAGEMEFRPTDETNPRGNLGSTCKHGLLVLNKKSWILKLASVINNYIKLIKVRNRKLYDERIISVLKPEPKSKPEPKKYKQTSLFDKENKEDENNED